MVKRVCNKLALVAIIILFYLLSLSTVHADTYVAYTYDFLNSTYFGLPIYLALILAVIISEFLPLYPLFKKKASWKRILIWDTVANTITATIGTIFFGLITELFGGRDMLIFSHGTALIEIGAFASFYALSLYLFSSLIEGIFYKYLDQKNRSFRKGLYYSLYANSFSYIMLYVITSASLYEYGANGLESLTIYFVTLLSFAVFSPASYKVVKTELKNETPNLQ